MPDLFSTFLQMQQAAQAEENRRKSQAWSYYMEQDRRKYSEQQSNLQIQRKAFAEAVDPLIKANTLLSSLDEFTQKKRKDAGEQGYELNDKDFQQWKEGYQKELKEKMNHMALVKFSSAENNLSEDTVTTITKNTYFEVFDTMADRVKKVFDARNELINIQTQLDKYGRDGDGEISEGMKNLYTQWEENHRAIALLEIDALERASDTVRARIQSIGNIVDWVEGESAEKRLKQINEGTGKNILKTMQGEIVRYAHAGDYDTAQDWINKFNNLSMQLAASQGSGSDGGNVVPEKYRGFVESINVATKAANEAKQAQTTIEKNKLTNLGTLDLSSFDVKYVKNKKTGKPMAEFAVGNDNLKRILRNNLFTGIKNVSVMVNELDGFFLNDDLTNEIIEIYKSDSPSKYAAMLQKIRGAYDSIADDATLTGEDKQFAQALMQELSAIAAYDQLYSTFNIDIGGKNYSEDNILSIENEVSKVKADAKKKAKDKDIRAAQEIIQNSPLF